MADLAVADRSGGGRTVLESSTMPLPVLTEPPAPAPGVFTCSERLPRDVLVRLVALSRQVGDIGRDHAQDPGLSLRLGDIAADLDHLIQRIHDETVRHLAGRRA